MNRDQFTISEQWLETSDGQMIYTQDWGNREANEVNIFLHGGPGGSSRDNHKMPFDPIYDRVIFFDQRGCGKSLPYGSLKNNQTNYLVNDINLIADHFGLKSFNLVGGSWGSCLALVYGIKYPKRINKMYLNGIFTARQTEIDYLNNGLFRTFYPDIWQSYLKTVPTKYQSNPTAYHFKKIFSKDLDSVKKSAYAYAKLESSIVRLDDRQTMIDSDFKDFDPSSTIIEASYMDHNCFLEEGYIFQNSAKLQMPIYLIQGRYDMICPPVTAYELSSLLPESTIIMTNAGHSSGERSYYDVLRGLLRGHHGRR